MIDAAKVGARAQALVRAGRPAEAESVLRRGLEGAPGHPVLAYALGILILSRGACAEAWPLYEHRASMPRGPRPPSFSFPQWRGEPVERLLVLPEQGFGDQIMFARYLPVLAARGIRVTVMAPPQLARLFEPLAPEVLPISGTLSVPPRDAWCFIGSLPGLTGELPTAPYLPGARAGSGGGVMTFVADAGRAPPAAAAELAALGRDLQPAATGARDFQDTADIIAGLALVISVDTAVLHVAGAMGKPFWVLLPHDADWRWGRGVASSQWYPSARLFRQRTPGDWAGVVGDVKAALVAAGLHT